MNKRDLHMLMRIQNSDPFFAKNPSRPAPIGSVPSDKQLEDSFDQTFGLKPIRKPKFDIIFAKARGLLGV